ncbi:MAG: ABC transporter permease, partial [Thermodesulfovibrionaceae bacterium]
AEVLSVKEREFVLAARAIGASSIRILFRHIIPNAIYPVIVAATFAVGGAILIESGLSFLGLGIQPPEPSWGGILSVGKDYITVAWWMSLFPGIAIFLTVLSFNLVGEALRDALDPKHWTED